MSDETAAGKSAVMNLQMLADFSQRPVIRLDRLPVRRENKVKVLLQLAPRVYYLNGAFSGRKELRYRVGLPAHDVQKSHFRNRRGQVRRTMEMYQD